MAEQMKKMILEIELLSDLCCSSGNGSKGADQASTFDEKGFPEILSKRIKGHLRKCGRFLCDNSYGNKGDKYEETLQQLFGNEKGQEGRLRISNGKVKNYQNMIKAIDALPDLLKTKITKNAISDAYSGLRYQTAIDEQGVAKEHSLRCLKVVHKNIVFTAEMELYDGNEKMEEFLEYCVKTFRYLGLNKNRGLGAVRCKLRKGNQISSSTIEYQENDEKVIYKYELFLEEDVVIKGGSTFSQDYISGSMLMGALAKITSAQAWFERVILNGVNFGNAYISANDTDFIPIPFSICQIKNNEEQVYDRTEKFERDCQQQYRPVTGYGAFKVAGDNGIFVRGNVQQQLNFHYTTGSGTDREDLFAYQTLKKGQTFTGFLAGCKGDIEILKAVLAEREHSLFLGTSVNAQYGKCQINIGQEQLMEQSAVEEEMVVEFLSDAILIDEYGNNSCDVKLLRKELEKVAGFQCDSSEDSMTYTKIITVGGFNNKWRLPKRQFKAFKKGTVLHFKGCYGKQAVNSRGYLGLLNQEGYGQYVIRPLRGQLEYSVKKHQDEQTKKAISISNDEITAYFQQLDDSTKSLVKKILKAELSTELKRIGMDLAEPDNLQKNICITDELSSSGCMRLLTGWQSVKASECESKLQEYQNYIETKCAVNSNLKDLGRYILKQYKLFSEGDKQVFFEILNRDCEDELFECYFRTFIEQMKRNYQNERKEQKA